MSSRRPPQWDDEEDWDDRERERDRGGRRRSPPPVRTFGLPIVAGALLLGLIIGFVASCGGGGTKTVTESVTVTAPASTATSGTVAPSGAASRATIALAVLNGSGEPGLAASRADAARGLGYDKVTEGNAPENVSSDQIFYRKGAAARAAQVAEDLGLDTPMLAQTGDPVLDVVPDANVIVVLGPTGVNSGTGTTG